MKTNIIAPT
jgi:putative transposase